MSRLRVPRFLRPPRRAAALALAGVSLSILGGDISFAPSGEQPLIVFGAFPKAMAWDWDRRDHSGGWSNRYNDNRGNKNGGKDKNRDDDDDDKRPSLGGHDDRRAHFRDGGAAQQPSTGTVRYDAESRMVRWGLKVGGDRHDRHDGREKAHAPWRQHHAEGSGFSFRHEHGDREHGSISEALVRNIHTDESHQPSTTQALEKAISPVAMRYREGTQSLGVATTIIAKTKIPFAASAFAQGQVLAVDLDPEAIEHARTLGFAAEPPVGSGEVVRLTVPPGLDAVRGMQMLSQKFPGHQFELNKIYRIHRAQMRDQEGTSVRSPPPGQQCTHERCFAREAIGWKETLGVCARGLKIGIIDTVIDSGHPAFAGRKNIHTSDYVPVEKRTAPDWHGTGVLSLLAANPQAAGTPGLIPDAEFYAASVFFADDDGEMGADTVSILQALAWLKKAGVQIVNMSFAGPSDKLVADEIYRMAEAGVIFVAAAGNEGPTGAPSYPAAYPQVIAVTAVTKDLRNYRYANRGDHVDVAAPGVDIWAAVPSGREGYHSGTSFAAPFVTAVLAVEPRDALNQEKSALLDSLPVRDLGNEGRDPIYGRGLLLAPDSCTPPSSEVASAE
jgi:subtilisin family serine protease